MVDKREKADPILGLVDAVRRRMLLLRWLESTGLGIAGASLVGAMLLTILIWRGQPAAEPAIALLSLGALLGLGFGLTRQVSRQQAAQEADRQFQLHELISTALSATDEQGPWAQTVRAVARQRVAQLDPSQLVLHRLGVRAWGAIGLATLLVITGGFFNTQPAMSQPTTGDSRIVSLDELTRRQNQQRPAVDMRRNPPGASGDPSRRLSGGEAERSPDAPTADRANDPTRQNDNRANGEGSPGQGSSGAGSSQSDRPDPQRDPRGPQNNATGQPSTGDDPSAGGGAMTSDVRSGTGAASGLSATDAAAPTRVPAWQSDRWPQAQSDAQSVLSGQAIPDEYHPLIRAYFDR